MAKIMGIKSVKSKLRDLGKGIKPKVSVIVGYTAGYALWVHESRGMVLKGKKRSKPGKGRYWDPQGKAKAGFLLDPAREMPLGKIVSSAVKGGASLEEGLLIAGLALQRESQNQVPVDTGGAGLKGSAFTKKE